MRILLCASHVVNEALLIISINSSKGITGITRIADMNVKCRLLTFVFFIITLYFIVFPALHEREALVVEK